MYFSPDANLAFCVGAHSDALKRADKRIPVDRLHFVVSTGVQKPTADLRKLIRRHVMLGKNQKKPHSQRKRQTIAVRVDPSSILNTAAASSPYLGRELVSPSVLSQTLSWPEFPVTVPPKFGSDVSTICFADAVKSGTVELILQFSSMANEIMFPLESCIFFERQSEAWIAPLVFDRIYLHAMIFTSQHFFDTVISSKRSRVNQHIFPHVSKTLELLQERLAQNDDQVKLSNTTVAVVVKLAIYAHSTGDSKSARHHMEGLCKIVNLRGGVTAFRENTKLLVLILRCDIIMALHSGSKPVFFNSALSQDPFLPYPDLKPLLEVQELATTGSRCNPTIPFNDMDDDLARTWKFTSTFCSVINSAADSEQLISMETVLDTMASVMYRLLSVHFESSSKSEAIRLGLIAFSCSVFHQKKQQYAITFYPHFTSTFKDCLVNLTFTQNSPELLVWLLMIGDVSTFDASNQGWLKSLLLVNITACRIDSWSKMQDLMKSFMWISLVHDKPGKRLFNSTIAC
ncbi:hypothetical protein K505DRAFT_353661 [Melanomma pulvis-pyrius CBS 109.77]|uniref:Transcription factor domain-containing protein n=1 Tax=Melanomma pulvis-pyrius CBS 109.77 TaxID=1314802 RepID=A0A6A6WUY4_9PLEO|nr:hypothetical protein K505DRAFT_353661 [Melanomma pulvis-pyrius CBS 109.77]